MRLFLLAVLLAALTGCEYRYQAVATDEVVYVIDKRTGQLLKPQYRYSGTFGPLPKYPEKK